MCRPTYGLEFEDMDAFLHWKRDSSAFGEIRLLGQSTPAVAADRCARMRTVSSFHNQSKPDPGSHKYQSPDLLECTQDVNALILGFSQQGPDLWWDFPAQPVAIHDVSRIPAAELLPDKRMMLGIMLGFFEVRGISDVYKMGQAFHESSACPQAKMFSSMLLKFVTLSLFSTIGALAAINQLEQINNFGTNPTNVRAYIYRPPNLAANPALILAMHYCTGTAQAYFTGTQYANLADSYKSFMVLYPTAPDSGGCWDVHTNQTFTHNAGGDSLGIASAVRHVISTYNVDKSRVFMTGSSSGAMMTNVMAGAYPELFAAGAAFAGVPYACFAGAGMWNSQCANGQSIKTAQQWGDLVRSGYPGYTGSRPRMAIYHGTNDATLRYQNHLEGIKQWTNVFGYSETARSVEQNSPVSGMTRNIYGPNFQAISAANVGHDLRTQEQDVLKWFGILPGGSIPVPSTTTSGPITTPPPTNCAAKWGQCGGQGWSGPTCCVSGSTCVASNQWYSQCQ